MMSNAFVNNPNTLNLMKTENGYLKKWLISASFASIVIVNAFFPMRVFAAPEEIQVYLDDFTEVGKPGLDIHTNYVTSGQQPTVHQLRVTPELSCGINTHWDAAAYFLSVKNPGEAPETDGIKIRARWRPEEPAAERPFYWAVNFEVGQLSERFYPDQSSGEVKLIGVWKTDPWTLGVNLNFDRALKSNPVQAASSEIDTKFAYQIREGLQIGIENYAFLGAMHNQANQPQSSVANYLAADFVLAKWDFNVGVGHVSGQSPDKSILKAIISVPF
jgi:hypothetical protein